MLANWSVGDWARVTTVAATLTIGVQTLPDKCWRFALATLITAASALLLSWIGGDMLKIALVTCLLD